MLTLRNRDTGLAEDALGNAAGALVVESSQQYMDLGLVVDVGEVAAGASVYAPGFVDGLEWVRHVIAYYQGDVAQAGVRVQTRNTSGVVGQDEIASTFTNAQTEPGRSTLRMASTHSTMSGMLGRSVKFGIRNGSAGASTYMRMWIQLFE